VPASRRGVGDPSAPPRESLTRPLFSAGRPVELYPFEPGAHGAQVGRGVGIGRRRGQGRKHRPVATQVHVYGSQLAPIVEALVHAGGLDRIRPDGSYHERAIWRASLRAWLAGEGASTGVPPAIARG